MDLGFTPVVMVIYYRGREARCLVLLKQCSNSRKQESRALIQNTGWRLLQIKLLR